MSSVEGVSPRKRLLQKPHRIIILTMSEKGGL